MLKERMTPDELAVLTGYSRQTINKWVRKQGWDTSPKPGVQGGKARLIHVNEKVREFIHSARRMNDDADLQGPTGDSSVKNIILISLAEMTDSEQNQLASLLLREGISGVLNRLGIRTND